MLGTRNPPGAMGSKSFFMAGRPVIVYAWFYVDGIEYGFHPADDARNPRGGSPVVCWFVESHDAARGRLLAAGCAPHRGPLRVDGNRQISQLVDPFGTIFGLDGP